jgi:SprT protein
MLITINPVYFLSNLTDMIEETVPHEVSHIIAGNSYGVDIKPHGKEWKEVIISLGKEPIICHTYDKKLA